jgi:glucokinase
MRKGIRLGVDVGGTTVKLALVDERGRVADRRTVGTSGRPKTLAAALRRAVGPWLEGRRVLGTGVGVAGDVDPDRGVVRFAPNLGWKNVPLKSLLEAAGFPRPLRIDNDATAAAWGARHTEVRGRVPNLVVLTLGTGVGGGLVLDGNLYHGSTGTAGELGHVCVDPDGPRCGCGAKGCLEAFVGNRHLVSWARAEYARRGRRAPEELTPQSLNERARAGDAVARAAWERAGRALGVAVAGFLNAFNPDAVLLTGGLAAAAPRFMPALRRELRVRAFRTPRRAAQILVSARTNDLGVVGAALMIP